MSIRRMENKIEEVMSKKVVSFESVGGGSIASSYLAHLSDKKTLFAKTMESPTELFNKEVNGLKELTHVGKIKTPEVYYSDDTCIVMEYIAPNAKNDKAFSLLAEALASMHQCYSEKFGFKEDNYIGATPQKNTPELEFGQKGWADFFIQYRLDYQFNLAREYGRLPEDLLQQYQDLRAHFYRLLEEVEEKPSLLHGDLWSGNFLVGKKGVPILIDPAVYYGHRETDIAMTKLFGGFNREFYERYHEIFPLAPGYETRETIYKLYHWINHVNLFGSGYLSEVRAALAFYQSRD